MVASLGSIGHDTANGDVSASSKKRPSEATKVRLMLWYQIQAALKRATIEELQHILVVIRRELNAMRTD